MDWRLLVKERIAKIAELGNYETLNWPLGRFSLLPEMSVCVCVRAKQNTLFWRSWRPLVEGPITNIGLFKELALRPILS